MTVIAGQNPSAPLLEPRPPVGKRWIRTPQATPSQLHWDSSPAPEDFGPVFHSQLVTLKACPDFQEQSEGLAHLGLRLVQAGKAGAGISLLTWLDRELAGRKETWAHELKKKTSQELLAAQGGGSLNRRVESLLGQVVESSTDPAMLGGLFLGGAMAQTVRAVSLGRFVNSGVGGARWAASALGFAAEIPTVLLATKGINALQGHAQDWSLRALTQEGRSLALNLLVLKGMTGLPRVGAVAARPAAWRGAPLQGSLGAVPYVASFAGIYLAQGLEETLKWRPRRDGASRFADSLAFWISAQVGGRLSQAVVGEGPTRFFREGALRAESPRPKSFSSEVLFETASAGVNSATPPIPALPSPRGGSGLSVAEPLFNQALRPESPLTLASRAAGSGPDPVARLQAPQLRDELAKKYQVYPNNPLFDDIVESFTHTFFPVNSQRMAWRYRELLTLLELPTGDSNAIPRIDLIQRAVEVFRYVQDLQPFRGATGNLYDHLLQYSLERTLTDGDAVDLSTLVRLVTETRSLQSLETYLVERWWDTSLERSSSAEKQSEWIQRLGTLPQAVHQPIVEYLQACTPRDPAQPYREGDFNFLLAGAKAGEGPIPLNAETALRALERFLGKHGSSSREFAVLVRALERAEASPTPLLFMDRIFKILITEGSVSKIREIAHWQDLIPDTLHTLHTLIRRSDVPAAAKLINGSVYTGYVRDMELAKKLAQLYASSEKQLTPEEQARRWRENQDLASLLLSNREAVLSYHEASTAAFREADVLRLLDVNPTALAREAKGAIDSGAVEFRLLTQEEMKIHWVAAKNAAESVPKAFYLPREFSPTGLPFIAVEGLDPTLPRSEKLLQSVELTAALLHEFEHHQHYPEVNFRNPESLLIAELRSLAETHLHRLSQGVPAEWHLARRLSPYGIGMHMRSEVDKAYVSGQSDFPLTPRMLDGSASRKPPPIDEAMLPEGVREIREVLADQNYQQRALIKLAFQKLTGSLHDLTVLSQEAPRIASWLAEAARVYELQRESLMTHRSRLFDYQVKVGIHPQSLSGLQNREEAQSTVNLRLRTQLELALGASSRSRDPGTSVQIARRLQWVASHPEFAQNIPAELQPLRISSIPDAASPSFTRYSAAMELLTSFLPWWTGEDLQAFDRAANGAVRDRDIALDLDSTLGDTLVRNSAADAVRDHPKRYENLDLNYFIHQFSRLRLPYRHMQATLLGLWAAGNRLRLFTAAENLPDNIDVFLNDFPLLKVAFNLAPPQDPLKMLTREDLHESPHFMDGLKRAQFYRKHFETPEGIALLLTIREENGFGGTGQLDFMKTTKMPFPDFPFQVLVDDLAEYYPGELQTIGLGKRWIMAPGSGEALYEKLEEYFAAEPPATAPYIKEWLGENEGGARPALSLVAEDEPKSSPPLKLLAFGDIHSDWRTVQDILDHEFPLGSGVALAVGDLETYPRLERGHQIYFIHGNHENFDQVKRMHAKLDPENRNYTPILAGDSLVLGGLKVAGLSGIHSPKFFAKPKNAPMKYFLPEHFERVKALADSIDIFLIHDAPKGVGFRKRGREMGEPLLTGIIEFLRPRLVFFGHHHSRFEGELGETRIVGLDYPKRSYVSLEYDREFGDLKLTEHRAKLISEIFGYRYGWQLGEETDSRPLFDGGFALENVRRIEEILETQYRKEVIDALAKMIESEMTSDLPQERKASQAWNRAALSVNEAVPYVARYVSRLEAEPNLTLEERKKLIGQLFDQMTKNTVPIEMSDDVRAFELFLKALKIVKL